MGVCALMVAIGLYWRAAAVGFGALFAYAHLCDKTNYLNHYYLIILLAFLMALLPLDAGSVDAWRRARAGTPMPRTAPAYALWALRGQLAVVYVFGGVAKLQPDWLVHAQPLKAWLAASTDVPVLGPVLGLTWVAYAASWAAAAFDLTIVGWLLWPRTRPYAYVAVVAFHVLTVRLFHLGMFPWVMMALTPIFFAPDWPRRLFGRLGGRPFALSLLSPIHAPAPVPAARRSFSPSLLLRGSEGADRLAGAGTGTGEATPRSGPGRLVASLLVAHLVIQLVFPLRSLAFPGPVLWTEEGMRFAWKVMVMEKSGVAGFIVRDPDSGRTWRVPATDYWTRYQSAMMATQPDMILEAAHVIAAEFRGRGVRAPEVRADVLVSLNGRPRRRLVDPEVDLAREPDAFGPYRWLLPAPDVDPP